MQQGWIKLHRKVIESEIWEKPPLYIKVWIFLLVSAQHSTYKGLRPGQVRTSIPDIIEACKWRVGARIERPSKDQIYQIIEWLRKPNEGGHESNANSTMITTTKATHGMLINISNYGVYQSLDEYESNDESNEEIHANQLRKQREPNNINKNVENYKNDRDKTYIILPNDGHRFLNIYGFHFKKKFNKEHMKITEEQLSTILQQLEGLEDNGVSDYEFEDAVIEHFDELPESNNGSIIAFMHTTKRRLGF